MSARSGAKRAVNRDGLWHRPEALDGISRSLVAVSALLLAGGALFWLAHRPAFGIDLVRITAAPTHVTQRQLEDVVRRELRGTFFTMDLESARKAFARLPWVREVALARRWPATLEVRIVEHEAVAFWHDGGLVDREGDVFQGASDDELPILKGPAGSSRLVVARFDAIRTALAGVGLRPKTVELSPRHAWRLELEGGASVDLGRAADIAALQRFVAIYPQEIEPLMPRVSHIDLRYRNGFALRSHDGSPLLSSAPIPTTARKT